MTLNNLAHIPQATVTMLNRQQVTFSVPVCFQVQPYMRECVMELKTYRRSRVHTLTHLSSALVTWCIRLFMQ